jgi:hypothetical protein
MRVSCWPSWFILAVLVFAGACEKPPADRETRILLGDPRTDPVLDPEVLGPNESARSWATAPWFGHPWLEYQGRALLNVDHDLGRMPQGVLVYISFTEDGKNPGLAAGDLAQIREVTSERVVIWNNTNGEYFARIVVF